jgi:hypothetical protein
MSEILTTMIPHDLPIVGGGVTGFAIGYFLKKLLNFYNPWNWFGICTHRISAIQEMDLSRLGDSSESDRYVFATLNSAGPECCQ